jgi:3-isopropylmalate dehydrogenase
MRPEQGLLRLRKHFDLFANLRPAIVYPELAHASTLRTDVVAGLDLLILRELTGDIYFGQPRGIHRNERGEREGFDTMRYTESEISRIARWGFEAARKRQRRLCSVDKANVLETTQLWRDVVTELGETEYSDVLLDHALVDSFAMTIVNAPESIGVVVTENTFGDILSDVAAAVTGGLGLAASASLGDGGPGLFEPVHGSAPQIAGQGIANPAAMLRSLALMLHHGLGRPDEASALERAVDDALEAAPTGDLGGDSTTSGMGDAVLRSLDVRT